MFVRAIEYDYWHVGLTCSHESSSIPLSESLRFPNVEALTVRRLSSRGDEAYDKDMDLGMITNILLRTKVMIRAVYYVVFLYNNVRHVYS